MTTVEQSDDETLLSSLAIEPEASINAFRQPPFLSVVEGENDSDRFGGLGFQAENLSIMIPNYNGGKYIGETIKSLLVQGDVLARAQIMVLDNASTDDSVAVVERVGKGRVELLRRDKNEGGFVNFNECYTRATRPWVYLLHSDDYPLPWFFQEVDACIRRYPEAVAIFGRSMFVDEKGMWSSGSKRLGEDWSGIMPYHPLTWSQSILSYVSVVVAKSAVEKLGGFLPETTQMSDWNLWWRIARSFPVAYTNVCLGAYRDHPESDSTRVYANGEFFDSVFRQLNVIRASMDEDPKWNEVDRNALYTEMFDYCLFKCTQFMGNPDAYHANMTVLKRFPADKVRRFRLARLSLRYRLHHLRRKSA